VEVRLLAVPESTPTTLHAFLEVFSSVGVSWSRLTGQPSDAPQMRVRVVSRSAAPFASPVGPLISPDIALVDAEGTADIVIVTDLDLGAGLGDLSRWAAETAWIRRQLEGGATVCSVCTGSLLLAASGVLDDHEATTHWAAAEMMRDAFPQVRLHPDRMLCASGPGQRIVSSGGPGSWEDLALHLIARFCGVEEAVRTAKLFVMGDRSRGQLLFSLLGRPRHHHDAAVGDAQAWIAGNYARTTPVAEMVARSGLPERTFKRRFRAATGYAPVDYVQVIRIEEAKHMLETSDLATDAIAFEVGYDDPSYFRRLFRRKTGVTPGEYRRQFARVLGRGIS
jgi:transcriptional regulator GlxA family with amidase domain